MQEYDSTETAELLERIRARDPIAFALLYDRYRALAARVAAGVLGELRDVEDVTQAVFLTVWRSPESFHGGNFAGWLVRMARNRALDELRRRAVRLKPAPMIVAPYPEDVEDLVLSQLEVERARRAIACLAIEQRELIERAFFDGYTYSELAREYQLPLGTVKTRVRAGLQRLRAALRDDAHGSQ